MGDACVPDFIAEISKGIQRYCAQLHTCAAELMENFFRLTCWFFIIFFLKSQASLTLKLSTGTQQGVEVT
jgi:hypothetical protein